MVHPLLRLEQYRRSGRPPRFLALPGARQHERQRGMRLAVLRVQLDAAAGVLERLSEDVGRTIRRESGTLEELTAGVGKADVGGRISGIQLDGPQEPALGRWHGLGIEGFEEEPPFDRGAICVEVRRLPRPADLGGRRHAKPAPELPGDDVLHLEDVLGSPVRLGVGAHLAGRDVDQAGGNPQPIAGPLEAARHDEIGADLACGVERRARLFRGFPDARAIDDSKPAKVAEIP